MPKRGVRRHLLFTMSERRSTYVFRNEDDYDEARDHLYRAMSSDYNDSNCLYFQGDWGGEYRIHIYSDCSDAVMAADIMREHRGKYTEV